MWKLRPEKMEQKQQSIYGQMYLIQFLISMSQVMFPPNSMLLMKDGDLKKEYSQSLRQKSAELT